MLTDAGLPQFLCGVLAGGGAGLLLVLVGGALAGVAGVVGAGGVAGPGPAKPGRTQVHWKGHTSSRGDVAWDIWNKPRPNCLSIYYST